MLKRTICSHRLKTKFKTKRLKTQPKKSKELKLKNAKQKKLYLEGFYQTQDNQHNHNSRATVSTATLSGRGAQGAWQDVPRANSTENVEENVRCQCSASITSP